MREAKRFDIFASASLATSDSTKRDQLAESFANAASFRFRTLPELKIGLPHFLKLTRAKKIAASGFTAALAISGAILPLVSELGAEPSPQERALEILANSQNLSSVEVSCGFHDSERIGPGLPPRMPFSHTDIIVTLPKGEGIDGTISVVDMETSKVATAPLQQVAYSNTISMHAYAQGFNSAQQRAVGLDVAFEPGKRYGISLNYPSGNKFATDALAPC